LLLVRTRRTQVIQSNLLAQARVRLHDELPALPKHTHLLVADLAEQVRTRARPPPDRE
jgi:hypothetical protein